MMLINSQAPLPLENPLQIRDSVAFAIWICTLILHHPVPDCVWLVNTVERLQVGSADFEFKLPDSLPAPSLP